MEVGIEIRDRDQELYSVYIRDVGGFDLNLVSIIEFGYYWVMKDWKEIKINIWFRGIGSLVDVDFIFQN